MSSESPAVIVTDPLVQPADRRDYAFTPLPITPDRLRPAGDFTSAERTAAVTGLMAHTPGELRGSRPNIDLKW